MKKWIAIILGVSLISGCTLETVEPEVKEEEEPVIQTIVEEFEPRDVTASYIIIDSRVLNVRLDADVDSEKLGQVADNETYQVLEEKLDSQKEFGIRYRLRKGLKVM